MKNFKFNVKAAILAAAVAIGVPVIDFLYGAVPAPITTLVSMLALAGIILMIFDKRHSGNQPIQETCSDIRSINVQLGSGNYVIRKSDGFALENKLKSYISDGVWYLESGIKNNVDNAVTIINIPTDFTFDNACINVNSGNVLVEGLAAKSVDFMTHSGGIQAKNVVAGELNADCGSGTVSADAATRGNMKIHCGSGKIELKLNNSPEDFYVKAAVRNGIAAVGNRELRHGTASLNEHSPFEMNISCTSGSVNVSFI